MFLKCIEISGFKSFPDKTQMHMNGSIMGVVGPNGSGKSNVSDAIRWVLGEQSPRSLRGGMMQDVIFAGTQTRPPRSFCEVTLVFDNTDGRLGMDYTEIEVTRRLHRSGESEYFINRVKCRLKDILELFRDTGVGREGYSIIGQGRIDDILSEKSTDRRRVFEEAAGIMKYRVRKEEAERKLERTRQNLVRVEDILREQAFLLEPLKKQADDAARYLSLSRRLKKLDVNLFLHDYEKLKEKISRMESLRAGLEEERAEKEKLLESLTQRLEEEREKARRIEDEAGSLAQQLSVGMAELERVEGEIRLCDERIANIARDSERVRQEAEEADKKAADLALNEKTNTGRIRQIENELERYKSIADTARRELETLTSAFEDRARILETVQSEKVQTIEKMADVRSTVSALEEKDRHIRQRLDELSASIAALQDEQGKAKAALASADAALAALSGDASALRASFNEAVQKERAASERFAKTQQALEAARREFASNAASARFLGDIRQSFEGYAESVKRLLLAGRSDAELGRRIVGAVADLISVPEKYETAVETCLGAALQNIVVNDEYDAKRLIAHLRDNRLGRVTFLPLASLRPRYLSAEEKSKLNADGVVGVASELVTCRAGQKAVDFLLGRTVIVEDTDTAIRVMRACRQALRVVTLDGDVFNPGGAITGGSLRRERGGLVSRDRREEELKKRADELQAQVSKLEAALAACKQEREAAAADMERLRGALHDNELAAAAERQKRETLAAAIKETAARIQALTAEREKLTESGRQLTAEINRFAALQNDMQQSSETRTEDYKRLEDEYTKEAAQIETLKQRLHDAELKSAELFRENAALLSDNARLAAERQEAERVRAARLKTLELNAESEENLRQIRAQLVQKQREKTEALENLRRRQDGMAGGRTQLSRVLEDIETQLDETRRALSKTIEKGMKTAFAVKKAQADIEAAQNRLWDMYQLTYAGAQAEREDISYAGAQAEADEIRAQLHEMGSVNPAAIDEYTALKERMAALETQKQDLEKAEEDLRKLIASLMSEMRRTFRDSFEKINKYFGETFCDLFNGGRAELVLEEDGDIMECGIEIVAEPPGKKLQKISLLSGGEKALTAISLLFALLRLNPSPVCVLDEIDAALDEANVRKFAEYLQRHAKVMQFIVITHRKPTMAVCNSLYGLAMEEKGVSKLLSVRLDKESV